MPLPDDLSKLLPVEKIYDDLASPAFKEVGEAAKTTVKAARLLLAPLDYLAQQQDRWANYIKRVSEKVSEESYIPAHTQLAGNVFDNLKYLEEDSLLTELFLNLLARAIDKERVSEAHPAFSTIIAQLSPDEAKVIYFLSESSRFVSRRSDLSDDGKFSPKQEIENHFPLDQLDYPNNYYMYIDHLNSLNLAGMWQTESQEPLYDSNSDGVGKKQVGVLIRSEAKLTPFGSLFAKACMPSSLDYPFF